MVLTLNIVKKSIALVQKDLYSITLTLTITDGAVISNYDFTQEYRTGQSVPTITAVFIAKMQDKINNYKSEQTIFNATQLDTAVTNIKNGLTP